MYGTQSVLFPLIPNVTFTMYYIPVYILVGLGNHVYSHELLYYYYLLITIALFIRYEIKIDMATIYIYPHIAHSLLDLYTIVLNISAHLCFCINSGD